MIFLNLLVPIFFYKSSPNLLVNILGHFKYNFHVKNDLDTFCAILEKIGQLFILSSGHTGCEFESWHWMQDGSFFNLGIYFRIASFEKDRK